MVDYVLEGPKWGTTGNGTGGGKVTWSVDASVPASFVAVLTAAFQDWSSRGNIQFSQVGQVGASASAQIVFQVAAIDGLDQILGQTSYSYRSQTLSTAKVVFDSGEGWHSAGSAVVSNDSVNLFTVALHEIGHAIGLDHYNAAPAIMNATLNRTVTDLTTSDIDGIQALYGPATVATLFGTVAHDVRTPAGQVYALYEGLLGRAPDPLGGELWAAALINGTSLHDVTQAMLAAPEVRTHLNGADNATFVNQLYRTVLGRQPDAGGQGWVDALNSGATSRVDLTDAFVFSAEHVAQLQPALSAGVFVADATASNVARLYYGLLDRAPDAAGLQAWTAAVRSGTDLTTMANACLISGEYTGAHPGGQTDKQFVDGLYQNALGRAADAGGEAGWLNALAHGMSRGTLAVSIAEAPEAQMHLLGAIEIGNRLA